MNKKGFTLIEMIFAMALLCIVTVIILRMYVTASTIEKNVDVLEIAALEASNVIEDFKIGEINYKTYYDEYWQEVESLTSAYYERQLYVEEDSEDPRLFALEVQVRDLKSAEILFTIKTKYYNTKE